MLIHIDDKDISGYINNCNVVLIHCHAKWSDPSQSLMTILEEISEEYEDNDNIHILALDIEENPETVKSYNIKAIPELLWFINGELWDRLPGVSDISVIIHTLSKLSARF